jgi:hypothetical protein
MAAFYDRGRYQGKIVNQILGENSKGNPELQLVVQPTAMYDEKGEPCKLSFPYSRTIYLVLTEATIGTPETPGWVVQTLNALGFNGKSFGELEPGQPDSWSCIGQAVDLRCDHDEYEGKEREKWSIARKPNTNGTPTKTLEKKSLRALDAKYGKVLKVLAETAPAPTAEPTPGADAPLPPPPAGRTEAEIPF